MGKAQSIGLLVLRIGIGALFVLHGVKRFVDGDAALEGVGSAMKMLGVTGDFKLWGTVAALTETVGGVALATGALFRPLCVLLLFVTCMASAVLLNDARGFWGILRAGYPLSLALLCLSLLFIGPGRYSLGKYINPFARGGE